jgi:hypothetical protein
MNDIQRSLLATLRRQVRRWLEKRSGEENKMWRESWVFLRYIFDLQDQDIELIELHASFVAGKHPFIWWYLDANVRPDQTEVAVAYQRLTKDIPSQLCIGAPPLKNFPRQNGILLGSRIVNTDIVRFQSAISNLFTMGILSDLKIKDRPVIMEVGCGFGGLAFQFSKILDKMTYVLVDIPEALFLAGAYLIVNHPDAKIYIYDDDFSQDFFAENHQKYDYMLIPDFALSACKGKVGLDLFINMASFQEMTEKAIEDYARFAADQCTGFLYSDNGSKHPHNELIVSSVEDILGGYFELVPKADVYGETYQESKVFLGRSKKSKGTLYLKGYIKILSGKARIDILKQRAEAPRTHVSFEDPLWKRKSVVFSRAVRSFFVKLFS